MAETDVKVNPGDRPNAIDIILDKLGVKHWPVYKLAFGDADNATRVDANNPLPTTDSTASYTQKGAKRVTIVDEGNTANIVGVYGEQLATDIKNDVIVQFQYNISSYDAVTDVVDTGTVTQVDNMAVISSGSGASAEAHIYSVNNIRYRPGHTALVHFTAMFENGGVANVKQRAGAFDDEDGLYVGYNGTDLVVGYLNQGVATEITSDNWNGDSRIVPNVDFTKLNVFRIKFGWLGTVPLKFQMLLPGTEEWVDIHTVRVHGVDSEPHIGNPQMPVQMDIVKDSAGATNVVMKTGSWQAGTFGLCQECGNRPFAHESNKTLVGSTEQAIIHYRSATTFQSKSNKVRTRLLRYQFFIDSPPGAGDTGTVIFRLRRVQSVGGTPSWNNIDANNSVIEFDQAGTYVSTGAVLGLPEFKGYDGGGFLGSASAGGNEVDAEQYNLFLDPGGIYVITAEDTGGNSVTVRAAFNWVELF